LIPSAPISTSPLAVAPSASLRVAPVFGEAGDLGIERDAVRVELEDLVEQDLVEVGAVQVVVGRAVVALVRLRERDLVQQLAGVVAPELVFLRLDADAVERVAQPQVVEHLHRVGALLDTGADLAELRRLLEDAHLEAALHQAGGGGEAAEPGTGYENLGRHGHSFL
jgi:predicted ArsR family transcriptional regulator